MGKPFFLILLVIAAGLGLWLLSPGPDPRSISQLPPMPAFTPMPPVAETRSPPAVGPQQPSRPLSKPSGIDSMAALAASDHGMQALSAGAYADAIGYFEQAAEGGVSGLAYGLARAYHGLGKNGEALLMARQAVVEFPERPEPWEFLGRLLYDADDLKGAVAAWQTALEINPESGIARALEKARHDVATRNRFFVGETRHFRIRFEGPSEAYLAQKVLDLLESAYSSVGQALEYYPDTVTETILYTQRQFFDVTRSPGWVGGVYDGRVRLPISGADQDPETLKRVVTHEYVHAAIAHRAGHRKVPTWFHEGLAVALSEAPDPDWVGRAFAPGADPIALNNLTGGFTRLPKAAAERAYAQSQVLVSSLVSRYGMFRVADLITALGRIEFEPAFMEVFGETPQAAFERAMGDYRRAA
ncbi:MAG: hypothetical protein ACE5FN_01085 [Leptospirillia bacterium]